MRLPHVVVIPSLGRPDVLSETLECLLGQHQVPDRIILAITSRADCPDRFAAHPKIEVALARKGLTAQLNAALRPLAAGRTLVTVLDDDVELHPDYLGAACEFLMAHPEVALIDGVCVADGNITRERARVLLREPARSRAVFPVDRAYGCNLTFRSSLCGSVLFDENLPSYGWLSDADFSVRASSQGELVRYGGCRFVHLAARTGRIGDRRFGYSQVANPLYLRAKGSLSARLAAGFIVKSLLANVVRCVNRRHGIHGRERLAGSLLALRHALAGCADPSHIDVMLPGLAQGVE